MMVAADQIVRQLAGMFEEGKGLHIDDFQFGRLPRRSKSATPIASVRKADLACQHRSTARGTRLGDAPMVAPTCVCENQKKAPDAGGVRGFCPVSRQERDVSCFRCDPVSMRSAWNMLMKSR